MKTRICLLVACAVFNLPTLHAQTTAFTYQGRLQHGGMPANGLYEMSFSLHDALTNGNPVGAPVTVAPVPVTNGLFTAALDFGVAAFMGGNRWIEIAVTVFGSDQPVVTLVPRQPLTPTPYALHASNAAGLMSFANAPLDIKVGGQRALRLEANSSIAPNIVGGSPNNFVGPGTVGATISGGGAADYLGKHLTNSVSGHFGTVSGGFANSSAAFGSTVSGGGMNFSSGLYSTVGGGEGNSACGFDATVAGGYFNTSSAPSATVSGGAQNLSSSYYATVPGGARNVAGGRLSFAAGYRANALHEGAFVWADSTERDLNSTADREFLVRASGGAKFYTDAKASTGAELASGSGTWSSLSDRNAKENFAAANPLEILDKVAALPLASWNYKAQGAGVRHLGPMAQDFHAAFGLGENDRTISTVDADGVALAAIQGLNAKVEEQAASLRAKEAELQELRRALAELKDLVSRLAKHK